MVICSLETTILSACCLQRASGATLCYLCDPGSHNLRREWLSGVGHPVKLTPSQEERMW